MKDACASGSATKAALAICFVATLFGGCGDPPNEPGEMDSTEALVAAPAPSGAAARQASVLSTLQSVRRDGDGKLVSAAGPVQEVPQEQFEALFSSVASPVGDMPRLPVCGWLGSCMVCCNTVSHCCCYSCGSDFSCGQNC